MTAQQALAIAALPAAVVDSFEVFWSLYPRKVGRAAARRSFIQALRRASSMEILNGLRAYPFSPERKYQPHAATWLNQDRWVPEAPEDLEADPWGLDAWLATHPQGWHRDALEEVLVMTGLAPAWRGDLALLGAWLADGYRPDSIALVCAEVFATLAGASRSLIPFDRAVRRRALRWDWHRHEWRRG